MFTRESVCDSINEVREWPMTPENVRTFADLLYIKERIGDVEQNAVTLEGGLTPEMAEQWAMGMENADGTRGPHWSVEKTEEIRKQFGIAEDPLEFWVTANMMYSDYCLVAEKMGVNNAEFYAFMARAFWADKDSIPNKLVRYYEYIVLK